MVGAGIYIAVVWIKGVWCSGWVVIPGVVVSCGIWENGGQRWKTAMVGQINGVKRARFIL